MTQETEALLYDVLIELLKYLKRTNEERDTERLEHQLAESRAKQWGYPTPQRRRH